MKTVDRSLILFHNPTFGLVEAHAALSKTGLTVTPQNESLIVRWYDGPLLTVRYFHGAQIASQIQRFGRGTDYSTQLARFDSLFEITFDDLDEVLDEINTLIEVQATLQDATQGFLYNTWNQNLSAPES